MLKKCQPIKWITKQNPPAFQYKWSTTLSVNYDIWSILQQCQRSECMNAEYRRQINKGLLKGDFSG